jgi:hypothetical protein
MQRRPSNQGLRGLVRVLEPVDLPRKEASEGFTKWLFRFGEGLGKSDLGDSPRMLVTKVYYVANW